MCRIFFIFSIHHSHFLFPSFVYEQKWYFVSLVRYGPPFDFALIATQKKTHKHICPYMKHSRSKRSKEKAHRQCQGIERKQISLLSSAYTVSSTFEYILFDLWFTSFSTKQLNSMSKLQLSWHFDNLFIDLQSSFTEIRLTW